MKSKISSLLIIVFLLWFTSLASARTQVYELEIKNEVVNFTGTPVDFALTVNGGIPGPVLRFVEGDEAIIKVKNSTQDEASIHWHGLLLPWDMDGVPKLNTPPIQPGETFTFQFPIRQNGTYWYHSHTGLQEQKGVYGAIVIEPREPTIQVDYDEVIVLSDWIDENPDQVMKNLRKDGEYYAWKKRAIPNYLDAFREGALKDYLINLFNRMDGMDYGDVGYDTFLINGKNTSHILPDLKRGDRVRLRIINAGASSYFHVNLGMRHFNVISADGKDVQPVMTKELLMGMAETYDILFTVPEDHVAYELKATPQDVTGFASVVLGNGHHVEKAPIKVKPSLYKMGMHHGGGPGGGHDGHNDGEVSPPGQMVNQMNPGGDMDMSMPLKYSQLKSLSPTRLPEDAPVMEFKINLSGSMERYVWTLNGKLLSKDTYIDIQEGSVIRFVLENETMMHHPMHLHGHFFRVLNGLGDFAPLKHTVDVSPNSTVTIEFLADEPGEWFFHCHNLYHMKAGMARVVRYFGFQRPDEPKQISETPIDDFRKMDSAPTVYTDTGLYSNGATWNVKVNGGWYEVDVEGEITDYDLEKIENEIYVRHYFSNYINIFGGLEYEDESLSPIAGMSVEVPFEFEVVGYTNIDGDLVFKVENSFRISRTMYLDVEGKKRFAGQTEDEDESEYSFGFGYQLNKNITIKARYIDKEDTENQFGVGAHVKY